jgi:hypothetical protein
MSYAKLLDAIILKQKAKKSKPQRRMEQSVFKMIVEMAYEMNYANRYCKAERTNRFLGLVHRLHKVSDGTELPFDTEDKKYKDVIKGDIVVVPHFQRESFQTPLGYERWIVSRIAKVIRINQKSISLADCDQDGQLIQYNPDEDCDFQTKEHRKDYNKLFQVRDRCVAVITGTKHLRYEGWDS